MIISSSLKNGISVDRSLCTSTYRDYSKTPYRNYGKTPCLLQNAYNIRSKMVHEGDYSVTQGEAIELMNLVQHIILTLIKFIGRWKIKTNEDLYQWLEKNRLRDRKRNN